jgi:hypothetical protein
MQAKRALTALAGAALTSLTLVAGTATPSSASVSDCPDFGVVCAYVDSNYRGKPIWTESAPGVYTFGGDFRKTSSIINRSAYDIKIIGENENLSLCIARGLSIRELPSGYADELRTVEIKPSKCTEWIG